MEGDKSGPQRWFCSCTSFLSSSFPPFHLSSSHGKGHAYLTCRVPAFTAAAAVPAGAGINNTHTGLYFQNPYSWHPEKLRVCCIFIAAYLYEGRNQSSLARSSKNWSNNGIKLCRINWSPTESTLEACSHTLITGAVPYNGMSRVVFIINTIFHHIIS